MSGFSSVGFGAAFPGFDIAGAYTGKYGKLGENSLGGGKKGMGLDPLTLGLGAVSSGFNFLSGMNQAATSANIAQAQLAAQNAAIQEGRSQAKGALGSSIWNKVFDATTGEDLAFGRGMREALFEAGPLAEKKRAQGMEERRGLIGLEGSAAAQELRQRANRDALKQSLAEKQAQMAGMFGPIAARDVGTFFV